jgi:hypothetical protein
VDSGDELYETRETVTGKGHRTVERVAVVELNLLVLGRGMTRQPRLHVNQRVVVYDYVGRSMLRSPWLGDTWLQGRYLGLEAVHEYRATGMHAVWPAAQADFTSINSCPDEKRPAADWLESGPGGQ